MSVYWSHSLTEVAGSVSIANNTSQVRYWMTVTTDGSSHNYDPITTTYYIDGVRYTSTVTLPYDTTTTIFDKTVTITHNADGSRTVSASSSCPTDISAGTITDSRSVTLTKIPRGATITAAPNFNDEENPTITYSNPAGNVATQLQACISLTGASDDIAYRDISKTGTSYTFNLTAAERNVLRNATTGTSRTVYFYVRSTVGGTQFHSNLGKTLTITNANPTLSATIQDVNTATKALTGDANKIVKYYSNAGFTITAAALKGATLVSTNISGGGKSSSAMSGTLTAVEGASFVVTATDSRGLATTQTINKTLVDYVKLTCNLTPQNVLPSGNLTFNVEGNYFNNTFGKTANTLTVQYRYKLLDGTYGSWTTITATKSGNTYSANYTITGLDYRQTYVLQTRAVDKLATINSTAKQIKSVPAFDWSGEDFQFHVPALLEAGSEITPYQVTGDLLTWAAAIENFEYFTIGGSPLPTGVPEIGTWTYSVGYVLARSTTRKVVVLFSTNDGGFAIKRYQGSTGWQSWEYYSTAMDVIIEQGSSQGWEYRKFASGVAECWCSPSLTITGWQAWGNLAEGKPTSQSWLYPDNLFVATPELNVSAIGTGVASCGVELFQGHSKTRTPQMSVLRPAVSSYTGTYNINMHAIGRWY
ncbi:MAG: hypothetical protein KBT27_02195 [Prevotellaceae bacterium]|nr:hypothetical protein [Candidatus Faecinaster equi]